MRHLLRRETAFSHNSLDSALGSLDLSTRDGYTRFLRAHFIGMAPLAPVFRMFAEQTLEVAAPDYAAMLAADLAELDIDAARLPRFDAPASPGLARLDPVGVTYVIAGSRLGIASIRKAPWWGSADARARAYMDDERGLAIWRALVAWLGRAEPSDSTRDAIVASANAAFAVFARAYALSGDETLAA